MGYKVIQRNRTFEDGVGRGDVLRPTHGSPKSSKSHPVLWSLKPGPHLSIEIVCFAKSSLVRFVSMSEFWVEKSLSQITGALEAHVEPVEEHQDPNTIKEYDEQILHMF